MNEELEGIDDSTEGIEPAAPLPLEDDEEFQNGLRAIIDELEKGDRPVREQQIRFWRFCELYWKNIQKIFWNETEKTWSSPSGLMRETSGDDTDIQDFDSLGRVIGIYKAHGESIIAALSSGLPNVRFSPDDADNPDDLLTAKAADNIAELIAKHNDADLLFVKALYIMFNQGLVFAYNSHHQSLEYGSVQIPDIQTEEVHSQEANCPSCGNDVTEQMANGSPCECGSQEPPDVVDAVDHVPYLAGMTDQPKSRELIEVFGPLNVKVPHYIKKLEDSPYLILETEHHYSTMRKLFPEIAEKINPSGDVAGYDRWARDLEGSTAEQGLVTNRRIWIRPSAYTILPIDSDSRIRFEKEFPNGLYCVFVNDIFAEATPESMDEHWTLTYSPTSMLIHADPLGKSLLPVQELINDLVDLVAETIFNGIPENFADPDVLDFKSYGKSRAVPGQVTAAKPRPGQNLDQSFYTAKPATLSQEVDPFIDKVLQFGQFVSGAFPSIYGGPGEGSETFGEYKESRNQALQRLSITWKVLCSWWRRLYFKSVKSYIANSSNGDDKFVKRSGTGFINVWIKEAELEGKLGDVESETSEQFPVSWEQMGARLLELLDKNNEAINAAIFDPNNVGFVARLLGFRQMHIPGEDDRNKQLMEIAELVKDAPTEMNPDDYQPTVMVEPDVDNHAVHIATLVAWLVSPIGIDCKNTNPQGYQNVVAHLRMHKMAEIGAGSPGAPSSETATTPGAESPGPEVPVPETPQ